MDNNILSTIRTSKGFTRSVTMLITLALLGVMLERTIYYALNKSDIIEDENVVEKIKRMAPHKAKLLGLTPQKQNADKPQTPEAKLSSNVQNIKEKLAALNSPYTTVNIEQLANEVANIQQGLSGLNQQVKENFAQTREHIVEHNLADVILQRHDDTVELYNEKFSTLQHKLIAISLANTLTDKKAKLNAVQSWLAGEQFKRQQQAFDPNNLPFQSSKPDSKNKPKISPKSFTQNGYFNSPNVQLAALGDFTFADLPGASNPAYLAETDEIVLSQSIKDLAATLNYDAVEIYHWVRNNVEWQPSWGAVQDTALTLDAQRGNAMDIASLTIALLRASQIPARYVHGTIEIPEAEFRNWAGGFSSIDAAANYASSAGIPTATVTRGGKIDTVQIEHIWVEVAADYHPSRAAKNINADSWVQIDPSFKQYEYLKGLDVVQIAGIDTNQLAQDVINSGTVNEQEGWVTGFDPAILQSAQTQVQTALENHITNNMNDPTVGDVIGGRKTIIEQHTTLASSLANYITVTGKRYDKLPASLQQRVNYRFLQTAIDQLNPPASFAWATVNNQKVTLSFKPATAEDEAALQSLLPDNITDISQLPSEIPSYLIEVIPQLKVNGILKHSGSPMKLGNALNFNTEIIKPGQSSNINYTYNIPAGSYVSVNTVAGNVSSTKLTELQTQLNKTKTTLEVNEPTQIASLTREEILGDMFYTGTLAYFAQLITFNTISALQSKTQYYLNAGYGTFGYEPKVDYFFGIPRAIQPGGVTLDIPVNVTVASNDNNGETAKQFMLQSGIILSTLEHATPEQLFNTDSLNPPNAFSAVKGLQIAAAQGQRIYQITQANITTTLPMLNLDGGAEAEIQQAVNSGKEVITHTDLVSVPGYIGAGYIIVDPITGEGAYKISGGGNGAFYFIGFSLAHLFMVSLLLIMNPATVALAAATLLAVVAIFFLVIALTDGEPSLDCFLSGFVVGISTSALLAGVSGAAVAVKYEILAIESANLLLDQVRSNSQNFNTCVSL